jgi:hypothetical protein
MRSQEPCHCVDESTASHAAIGVHECIRSGLLIANDPAITLHTIKAGARRTTVVRNEPKLGALSALTPYPAAMTVTY